MPNQFENLNLKNVIDTPVQGSQSGSEAARAAAEAQARAAAEEAARTSQSPESGRRRAERPRRKGGVAVMASGVVLVVGAGTGVALESNDVIDVVPGFPAQTQGQTGGNGGEGQNGGNGGIEGNTITIEVSPESLASLEGAQITEALSIPAVNENGEVVTPEEYAQEFANNFEGFLNSGTTEAEFAPYREAAAIDYTSVMQAKYDDPAINAIFDGADGMGGARQNHQSVLNLARAGYTLETGQFTQGFNLESVEVIEPQTSPEDDFTIEITANYTSNADELGITDLYEGTEKDISANERTETYLLHVTNVNGNLKTSMELQ